MADQPALPLRERFGEWISNSDEKTGEDIDAVKKKRLDEASRLAKYVLPRGKQERNTGISRDLKVDSGGEKLLAEVRSTCTKPRPGESIPLPTPPRSPVASIASKKMSVWTTPVDEISTFQEIEDIRTSLNNHKAEIALLRLEIRNIQVEVQDLN